MQPFKVEPTWSDKDSRVDRFRVLYEQQEFLPAYAAHTDLRVTDNPRGAIGREDEWETHGVLQLDFLIVQGLTPDSRFLDLGCGTGRLARKVTPYLREGFYTGADISANALAHAEQLSVDEGWSDRCPAFVQIDGTLGVLQGYHLFDMVWAHSVFTHLPENAIEEIVAGLDAGLGELMEPDGKFLFTYKRGKTPERTGLKQWRYPDSFFADMARKYGFKFEALPMVWPASQRTGLMRR